MKVKQILFLGLLHLNTNRVEYPFETFQETIWKIDPVYHHACIGGVIEFAKMQKQRKWINPYGEEAEQERIAFLQQQETLAERVAKNDIVFDLSNLSFETHAGSYLTISAMIIPFDSESSEHESLLRRLYQLHFNWNKQDQDRSNSDVNYEIVMEYQTYLAKFFLQQESLMARILFSEMLESVFSVRDNDFGKSISFVEDVIKWIISEQDTCKAESFWILWEIMEAWIRKADHKLFVAYLLLWNQYWKSEADRWEPLDNKSYVMQRRIAEFGHLDVKATMQLLSGIGTEALMPQGINWLNAVFNNLDNPRETFSDSTIFTYSEKLIQRTHYRNLRQIKTDPELQQNLLVFLNLMVDLGSSLAFIVRERLIVL